jgi:hypothetical protein
MINLETAHHNVRHNGATKEFTRGNLTTREVDATVLTEFSDFLGIFSFLQNALWYAINRLSEK